MRALWKDTFREIKGTFNRFIAIVAIVALGVGFFAGLKATTPDMQLTADQYFKNQHFMDVRLLSTMGFTEDDVAALREQDYIDAVMPFYTADVLIETSEGNEGVKLYALPEDTSDDNPDYLNRPVLTSGRLPEKPGECAIDPSGPAGAVGGGIFDKGLGDIGNVITLSGENLSDTLDLIESREFTVVGTVESPAYISFQRGSTDIGNGTLSYYMFVSNDEFDSDYYLEIDATVRGANDYNAFSQEYEDMMDGIDDKLEEFAAGREQARYDQIISDAEAEIQDAQDELDDGRRTYEEEKADAEKQLADAKQELDDAEQQIADGLAEIEKNEGQIASGQREYESGLATFQKEIRNARNQLNASERQIEQGEAEVAANKATLDATAAQLRQGRAQYEAGAAELETGKEQLAVLQAQIAQMEEAQMPEEEIAPLREQAQAAAAQIEASEAQLAESLAQIEAGEQQLAAGRSRLQAAQAELRSGRAQLEAGRKQLAQQEASGQAELNSAKRELDSGRAQIASARSELEQAQTDLEEGRKTYEEEDADARKQLADAEKELDDGQAEIDDARAELEDVDMPEWYVLDRFTNIGFMGYASDTDKVERLSDVFPVFFFLVAALVCLTTMTRMVEEQRTQIGVLKALGYSKVAVAGKYLIYAVLATFAGCAAGLLLGFWIFPTFIAAAYKIMYSVPPVICEFNWPLAIVGSSAALASTLLAALWASYNELSAVPAELIRPKAPPPGKRVFLERMKPLWSRMKFSQKLTTRNLFRYKKRFFMTVIGIAGCTALMLTGFGLQDSVKNIVSTQFDKIHHYDVVISLKDPYDPNEEEELTEALGSDIAEKMYVTDETGTARALNSNASVDVHIVAAEDPERLENFISFQDRTTGESVDFPAGDRIVITEKAAAKLGVGVGDTIELSSGDTKTGEATIGGITENYVYNYIYMTPDTYDATFGEAPEYMKVFANVTKEGDEPMTSDREDAMATQLIESDLIDSVEFTSKTSRDFDDVMKSLDSVIVLIIACASLLAFIVLYNLANINVTERVREIATIKVLGFFDNEVSAYVFRENVILTAIGGLVGLFGGIALHQYVVATAEVDIVMFMRTISLESYIYSYAMTFGFAFLVNWVMGFKLRKISMVESLKSTE